MDDLLEAAGAVNVDFPLKTACCGGAHTLSDSDTSTQLVLNILQAAEDSGAEVIATECPTCHSGLEMHQIRAETQFGIRPRSRSCISPSCSAWRWGLSARKLQYTRTFGLAGFPARKRRALKAGSGIQDSAGSVSRLY